MSRLGALRSLSVFTAAFGLSSAVSLLASLVLARALAPGDFAGVSYVLFAAALVATAGAGIDTAIVRLTAKSPTPARAGPALLKRYLGLRLGVYAGSLVVVIGIGGVTSTLQGLAVVSLSASQLLMFLRITLPLATHQPVPYALYQVAWASIPLAASLVPVLGGGIDLTLHVLALSAAGFSVALLLSPFFVDVYRAPRTTDPDSSQRSTVVGLLLSGLVFAFYERIDAVLVPSLLDDEQAGTYFAALRLAGIGLVVISGAQAALISLLRGIDKGGLPLYLRRSRPVTIFTAAVVVCGIAVAPVAVAVLLGGGYAGAATILQVLLATALVRTLLLSRSVVFPLFSTWPVMTVASLVPMAVKCGWLLAFGDGAPTAIALGSLAGAAASAVLLWALVRPLLRVEPIQVPPGAAPPPRTLTGNGLWRRGRLE